jgi:hypothetical protein
LSVIAQFAELPDLSHAHIGVADDVRELLLEKYLLRISRAAHPGLLNAMTT